MIYYLAAYAIFWAVLFGYLLGLSSRQRKLNARAARLRERLAEKGRARASEDTETEAGVDVSTGDAAPEEGR